MMSKYEVVIVRNKKSCNTLHAANKLMKDGIEAELVEDRGRIFWNLVDDILRSPMNSQQILRTSQL